MDIYIWEDGKFYNYYQIDSEDDEDESDEFGSGIKEESKSHMEGSHSLFGIIWSIQKETGWSHDYVLWGESWFNLQMKLPDVPKRKKGSKTKMIDSEEELLEFLGE